MPMCILFSARLVGLGDDKSEQVKQPFDRSCRSRCAEKGDSGGFDIGKPAHGDRDCARPHTNFREVANASDDRRTGEHQGTEFNRQIEGDLNTFDGSTS